MIHIDTARELLDMGARIGGGPRAQDQLSGAVAVHNILTKHGVAYLADEVGMGKTYVAMGAIALFRHFHPGFRVLVIAPRENIQRKWMNEFRVFARNIVRFPDLRTSGPGGQPARPLVLCRNLVELVRETTLDPDRDFFARLTSFSLPFSEKGETQERFRSRLRDSLPWLSDEALDLRQGKEQFKLAAARAACCAIPPFDLVVVDEAHNLKHGKGADTAARNQVLAALFGSDSSGTRPHPKVFPGFGPRAKRVLFLSATPLEESYRQLWNQLDIFGMAHPFEELAQLQVKDEERRKTAGKFLVRRVTSIQIADVPYTKNQYRREWRGGGVEAHDDPIHVTDPRQRLIIALVQKKVSELLSGKRFNNRFQIGMLASFESFLETARVKRDNEEGEGTFDGLEQTDDPDVREGLDVRDINRLAKDHRKTFGCEMPHPKMDALVARLENAWKTGEKGLVFVRRVASVGELKRKLDDRYDSWLKTELLKRLPRLGVELEGQFADYEREKFERAQVREHVGKVGDGNDRGGIDTFFAWFFRGEGPAGVLSGAHIQARLNKGQGPLGTIFAINHVMGLLGATPGTVLANLAGVLGMTPAATREGIRQRAAEYLTRAKDVKRGDAIEAAQAAALELLREGRNEFAERAMIILAERYWPLRPALGEHAASAPPQIAAELERTSFFTRLQEPQHAELCHAIWPSVGVDHHNIAKWRAQFRERELRALCLATAARLGHAFIDLYAAVMEDRKTLALGTGEEREAGVHRIIDRFLRTLRSQQIDPAAPWGAFHELHAIAENFQLVLDLNLPTLRDAGLGEAGSLIGALLRQQHPVGGMSGTVNQTMVRQFRMPGYPFVLITTDVLQEGEDLHPFCSSVYHYGLAWTPSATEQRIGRIDRVRSQTERRLVQLEATPTGEDKLQVYFPYLQETIELQQAKRVFERLNTFIRMMHQDLRTPAGGSSEVDVKKEIIESGAAPKPIERAMETAFPIPAWALKGKKKPLHFSEEMSNRLFRRFEALQVASISGLPISWAASPPAGSLLGTVQLPDGRIQPIMLQLTMAAGLPAVKCVSPIGRTHPEDNLREIARRAARCTSRIGAILTQQERSFDLTVEDDVVLADGDSDRERVGLLVERVAHQADWMEREHFGADTDAPMDTFKSDLTEEASDGD